MYLDGVGVSVAALAQVRGSQGDAGLDGLWLAREVAQVELRFREEILPAGSRDVFHPLSDSFVFVFVAGLVIGMVNII